MKPPRVHPYRDAAAALLRRSAKAQLTDRDLARRVALLFITDQKEGHGNGRGA